MPELPTGTVTFLFTDIEGSTRLWEQHPKVVEVALAGHDALAVAAIHACHGVLVKHRGEGDSLFAVFAGASDAVAAAANVGRGGAKSAKSAATGAHTPKKSATGAVKSGKVKECTISVAV